ncbi:MAG: glutamate--tRNA ligase [Gammaproteobacteria bacterium]|nr:glutamate--tRNA ligase [Gammaproteobacteria bacterium]
MQVVTRFPPSPTGYLHLGGARTALFNWLFARNSGGKLVLRIEDTDRQRSTDEAINAIVSAMEWLGLDWDEGPHYQTQRLDRYKEVVQQLLEQGDAYYCSCTPDRLEELRNHQRQNGIKPRYDGHCRELGLESRTGRNYVVRFKNPLSGSVTFNDRIRGPVSVQNEELDDLVLERSDGMPTYNLAVVVDDMDMNISHVIRGEDHINNTFRQINIFRALGHELPEFAHVPLILGSDRKRLSKRNGDVSVLDYRDRGILPEALINYLVRLGWSHGDQEIFSREEMIRYFDLRQVNKSSAGFDMEKLLWINRHYIVQSSIDALMPEVRKIMTLRHIDIESGPYLRSVMKLVKERASTLVEIADQSEYFYRPIDQYNAAAIARHCDKMTSALLEGINKVFSRLEPWTQESVGNVLKAYVKAEGMKFPRLAQPLRIAISGSDQTPSIDATLALLGSTETIKRTRLFIDYLEQGKYLPHDG